jgi:hypothetical protein
VKRIRKMPIKIIKEQRTKNKKNKKNKREKRLRYLETVVQAFTLTTCTTSPKWTMMKKLRTAMNGSFEDQSWAEVNKRITLRTYWLIWQKMILMTALASSQTITQTSTTLLITLTSLPLVSLEDRLHGLFWNISRNQNQGFTGGKSYLEQKNCKLFWTWVKSMSKNSLIFL